MQAEEFVLSVLKAVKALNNVSITAMIIPQEILGDAITYFRVSTEPLEALCIDEDEDENDDAEFVLMQIDFWGREYNRAVELFSTAKKALRRTGKAIFIDRRDERDLESNFYRITTEFKIFI
jgi:hypothetical protein